MAKRRSWGVVAAGLALLAGSPALADGFDLPPPAAGGKSLNLYATRYYVHAVTEGPAATAVPLLSRSGQALGPKVSQSDFCFGALQGTIAFRTGDALTIYNVDGLAPRTSANCAYRKLDADVNRRLGAQAWLPVTGNGTFGLGVQGLRLVPYRTIAVDPVVIRIGTVLFIPRLKGFAFKDGGQDRIHDGYVIAGDVGGGVKGNHVDVFTGNDTGPPPPFVTSRPSDQFEARVVTAPDVVRRLKEDAKYRR